MVHKGCKTFAIYAQHVPISTQKKRMISTWKIESYTLKLQTQPEPACIQCRVHNKFSYIYMQQERRKCQHCESNLAPVDSSPSKWTRMFIGRFLKASVVLVFLDVVMNSVIPEFHHYRVTFLLIGILVIAILVQIPMFKRSKLITTYKCEHCSRYSAFSDTVGWRDITNR